MINKDKHNSIRVVSLSGYEIPEVKEVYNKKWISYGENNDYFDILIERYLGSPTNSRCINGIVDMVYGRGLEATDSAEFPEMYAKFKVLIRPKDVKRVSNDYKMLGQAAMQVVYNKSKTKIIKVLHFPMECLRAEKCDSKGVIRAYYYHPKWSEIKPSDTPKRIPTFGNGAKSEKSELYIFKPYRSGFYYYAPVDYHGCLQYCSLEEEVSNYHISNIKQGLQPSLLINFNNGIPNEETQEIIERKIYDKFSGSSNAGKFILAFNESIETKADLEPIHLPDAHAQYQFLSDESREKIMLGHGIVSPILLGIKDNTGFGNNAEELRTASILMDNIVIRPFQEGLIEGINDILNFNKIYLNLYFVTLQPIEFTELDNISTRVKREEETGEKLSSDEVTDFDDEQGDDLLEQLEALGERISDDWELIHSEEVKDSEKGFNLDNLAGINSAPNKKSKQDRGIYKVRYAYMPVRKSPNSREFCKRMELYTQDNIVFRKEDIGLMSFRGVNKKLGHKGRNYSLFKYKGGKNCKHYWELRVYKKKVSDDAKISVNQATKDGFVEPNNPSEVSVRPADMPNSGAYPNS
tara:strand:+ start:8109 stop:9845 length:1737 start_codon:yes stop_codon:yes gene_type:complete